MLSIEQSKLLIHLKQYGVADRETCNLFVDDNALRPLLRYKYISYHDWVYRLLKKGSEETVHIQPLVTVNGNTSVIERALKTSRLAALFVKMGIQSAGVLRNNVFIPSPKWREIRKGVTSTAMFNGVLCRGDMRLVIYDIGAGDAPWQAFAETSLFYQKYAYQTRATGMILVCDGDPIKIAEQILRYTISNRKALMKRTKLESDKKWSYSTGPIRLRPNYEKVYITDKSGLAETLELAINAQKLTDYFNNYYVENFNGVKNTYDRGEGDVEVGETRYFIDVHGDLLKFALLYNTVKNSVRFYKNVDDNGNRFAVRHLTYNIVITKEYERLAKLYDLPYEYSIVEDNWIREILDGRDSEEH